MPVVSRREGERSGGDRFDLMLLVRDLLSFRVRIVLQPLRSPFTDDPFRLILTFSKTKTGDKYRIVIVDGSQREKSIFRIELFDLLQSFRSCIFFGILANALRKKSCTAAS